MPSEPSTVAGLPGIADLVEGIDHVGLAVADLDTAITLHTTVFGWRLDHTETNLEQGVVEAMLTLGDGSGAQLQLLAPTGDDSPIGRFLDRRGPGLQQFALRVGDLVAVCEIVRQRGLRLLYETPRRGTRDSLVNFVHPADTFGVLVELVQPRTT